METKITNKIKKRILGFEKAKLESYFNHMITRKLGTFSLFVAIVNLFLVIAQKLAWADWDILTAYSYEGYQTGLFISWLFLCFIMLFFGALTLSKLKSYCVGNESEMPLEQALASALATEQVLRKKLPAALNLFALLSLILIVILLLITSSEQACPVITAVAFALYLFSYFQNKQHGYTRSWSRYEKTQELLRVLLWQFEQLPNLYYGLNKEKRLAELHEKYVQILENQIHERQRDIIGDYLATNDAAFTWVKNLKK